MNPVTYIIDLVLRAIHWFLEDILQAIEALGGFILILFFGVGIFLFALFILIWFEENTK